MARKQPPLGISDSGSAGRVAALLAAFLLAASVLAPVSTTAAVGLGDHAPVVGAAGNADEAIVANDDSTTTVANEDSTTTIDNGDSTSTVANDDEITIRGRVEAGDGEPVANDSVLLGSADRNRTDERGRFRLRGQANRSYDLTYRRGSDETGDGRPAVYAIGRVNASADRTRNVSLPAASALNVTVVAENGTAVPNATVRLTHARGGANATITGQTDARSRLTVGGDVGVDLAGNVTVAVESPNSSFENRTVSVSVTDATDRLVTLPLTDDERPTLRYRVAPKEVNVSETVTFDARNVTDESGVAETKWTVRGRPWYTERLNYSFPEPGTYSVRLSATDWAGNENNTTETVTVVDERPPDPVLSVSVTADETNGTTGETNGTTSKTNVTTVETNESVRFDASNSSDEHRIAAYRWDFDGDGTPERTTNRSVAAVTHEYAENGTYDATVTVVDESGNEASMNRTMTVELPPPTAAFSVSDHRPEINQSVRFDASATTAPANVSQYDWTFEGGQQVPDQQSFRTNFTDSGTYNVTLTVTDERGRTDRRTETVVVPNDPPKAEAGDDLAVVAGSNVTLDARHTDDIHDDFSVAWTDTTDSGATLSNASAMRPTVAAPEVNDTTTLRFELTATDSHGATDTDTVRVVVVPSAKPNVTQSPASPTVGESVVFRVNRSGEFRWDFDGDGAFEATPSDANTSDANATNTTVTHEFDTPGEYNVTVADAAGREVLRNVTVAPANGSTSSGSGADDGNVTDSENATDDGNTTDAGNATDAGTVGDDSNGGGTATGGGGAEADSGGASNGGGGSARGQSSGGASTGGQSGGAASTGGSAGSGTDASSGTGGSSAASSDDSAAGDGSATGDDSATGDADTPASASVTVERVGEATDRVVVSVEDATAGDRAAAELPTEVGGNRSALDAVSVVPTRAANFSLSVGSVSGPPADATAPSADEVLSYLEVEERNLTDADVASARFRFRVAVETLEEVGVAPESVRLYRYHDGEWQTLATSIAERVDGFYRFESASPGFSVFAVGVGTGATGADSTTTQSEDGGGSAGEDSESDDGSAGGTAESADRDSGSSNAGGVSNSTLIVGLFVASLLGAALWGYLLS